MIVAALAGLWLASACRQLNESHCGNQDEDATCKQRDMTLPYCNLCVATNDGCVAEPATEPACIGGSTSMVVPETTASSTTAPSDSSTTASEAADSSTTGEILCGNGVIDEEAGEVCDGELLPEDAPDCSTEGYGMGPPSCQDDCSRLNYMMCPGYVEECGNEEVGVDEECDGTVFGGGMDSCDAFPNLTGDGLDCNEDCTFDTTDCMICRESGESCTQDDTCCNANEVCSGLMPHCCVLNPLGLCSN